MLHEGQQILVGLSVEDVVVVLVAAEEVPGPRLVDGHVAQGLLHRVHHVALLEEDRDQERTWTV